VQHGVNGDEGAARLQQASCRLKQKVGIGIIEVMEQGDRDHAIKSVVLEFCRFISHTRTEEAPTTPISTTCCRDIGGVHVEADVLDGIRQVLEQRSYAATNVEQ
jgi:hypothetical protein